MVFQSALTPGNEEFTNHFGLHGDGVKDVAFTVDDCRGIYQVTFSNRLNFDSRNRKQSKEVESQLNRRLN